MPAKNLSQLAVQYDIPEEVLSMLHYEWPVKLNAQQLLHNINEILLRKNFSVEKITQTLVNIKKFIHSPDFLSPYKRIKTVIIKDEIEFVRENKNFNSDLEQLTQALETLPKPEVVKTNNSKDSKVTSNSNYSNWWIYPIIGLSLFDVANAAKKNNKNPSSEMTDVLIENDIITRVTPGLYIANKDLPGSKQEREEYVEQVQTNLKQKAHKKKNNKLSNSKAVPAEQYKISDAMLLQQLQAKKDYRSILAFVEEKLNTQPQDPTFLEFKIDALTHLHRAHEANEAIKRLAETHPASTKFLQAQIDVSNGDYRQALTKLEQAHEIDPQHSHINDALEHVKFFMDPQATAEYWLTADTSKAFEKPIATKVPPYGFICSINNEEFMTASCRLFAEKDELNNRYKEAVQVNKAGNPSAALKLYNEVLAKLPKNDPYFNLQLGMLHLSIAQCHQQLNQLSQAKKHYEMYFTLDNFSPINNDIYANYGEILLHEKNYPGAVIAYDQALTYDQHTAKAKKSVIAKAYIDAIKIAEMHGFDTNAILDNWKKRTTTSYSLFERAMIYIYENRSKLVLTGIALGVAAVVSKAAAVFFENKDRAETERRIANQTILNTLNYHTGQYILNSVWQIIPGQDKAAINFSNLISKIDDKDFLHTQGQEYKEVEFFSVVQKNLLDELEKTLKKLFSEDAISRTATSFEIDLAKARSLSKPLTAMLEDSNRLQHTLKQALFIISPEFEKVQYQTKLQTLLERISSYKKLLTESGQKITSNADIKNFYDDADNLAEKVTTLQEITEPNLLENFTALKKQFLDMHAKFEAFRDANDNLLKNMKKSVNAILTDLFTQTTKINELMHKEVLTKEEVEYSEQEIQAIINKITSEQFTLVIEKKKKKAEELFSKLSISYQKLVESHKHLIEEQNRILLARKPHAAPEEKAQNKKLEQEVEEIQIEDLEQENPPEIEEVSNENNTNNQSVAVQQINPYLNNPFFNIAKHCELVLENLQSPKYLDIVSSDIEQRITLFGMIFTARKLADASHQLLPIKIATPFQHMRNNLMHFPYVFDHELDVVLFVAHRLREYCKPVFAIFNNWDPISSLELNQLPDFAVNEATFLTEKMKDQSLIRKQQKDYLQANAQLMIDYTQIMRVILTNVATGKALSSANAEPELFLMLENLLSLIASQRFVFSKSQQFKIENFVIVMNKKIAGKTKFSPELTKSLLETTEHLASYFVKTYSLNSKNYSDDEVLNKILDRIHTATASHKSHFHRNQFLKKLPLQSYEHYLKVAEVYSNSLIEQDIVFHLDLLDQYLNYAIKVLNINDPEERVVYEHHGMLHSAMKESITRIAQAIRDLPADAHKEIRHLIKTRMPALWLKEENKSYFEFYRDKIGHEFNDEPVDSNNNAARREIYEEITPSQLIEMAKHANQLKAIIEEKFVTQRKVGVTKAPEPSVTGQVTQQTASTTSGSLIAAPLVSTLFRQSTAVNQQPVVTEAANENDSVTEVASVGSPMPK